ncbi:MAG: DJ-1/PfpI family protein [Lachnospiraceae bacterium]|nr:DJ-1/PfpI family protein [Lachnospiraceae bacterium]
MSELKRAALLLAEGYEEGECVFVIDILRRGEIACDSVSVKDEYVTGGRGIVVKADRIISREMIKEYDMVIIPGGIPGVPNLCENEIVLEWVRNFMEDETKYVAAICAGPMLLSKAGVSRGRRLTSYPADKYRTLFRDAEYVEDNSQMDELVVTDERLITSRGPASALSFAYKLVEILGGNAGALREKMQYNALLKR